MRSGNMSDWQEGFINSNRGHYILAQALWIAIKELNKVEGAMKEYSNIKDMEFLLNEYFSGYNEVFEQMDNIVLTPAENTELERDRQYRIGILNDTEG